MQRYKQLETNVCVWLCNEEYLPYGMKIDTSPIYLPSTDKAKLKYVYEGTRMWQGVKVTVFLFLRHNFPSVESDSADGCEPSSTTRHNLKTVHNLRHNFDQRPPVPEKWKCQTSLQKSNPRPHPQNFRPSVPSFRKEALRVSAALADRTRERTSSVTAPKIYHAETSTILSALTRKLCL